LYLLKLALCLKICSVLEKIPWTSGKNVSTTVAGWIFCRCLLSPLDLWWSLTLKFHCWFFCLGDLSIYESGVLKTSTIIVSGTICPFEYRSVFWNWVHKMTN
jgi:hypothetical protein